MTDPTVPRPLPGSWSGGRHPGWCEHCAVEHRAPCGVNSCLCPCPEPEPDPIRFERTNPNAPRPDAEVVTEGVFPHLHFEKPKEQP